MDNNSFTFTHMAYTDAFSYTVAPKRESWDAAVCQSKRFISAHYDFSEKQVAIVASMALLLKLMVGIESLGPSLISLMNSPNA